MAKRMTIQLYQAVQALEADNTPRKYSADDLRAIKATYQAKRLELEKKNDR